MTKDEYKDYFGRKGKEIETMFVEKDGMIRCIYRYEKDTEKYRDWKEYKDKWKFVLFVIVKWVE